MTRPARRLVLILALGLLAGCSSASSGREEGVHATTSQECADLVVIGARGSTQDPDLNAGVGTEVRRTTEELVRALHERSDHDVHVEAIRYDAAQASTLAAYQAHTAQGSRMMTSRLRALASECAGSRFALVGFSQGAQVVHGAASSMPSPLARRVVLVAMIADPHNDPSDPITRWSYADEPTSGRGRLGPGPPIDTDLRAVAISLCVDGDEVCNDRGAPGGPPSSTHKRFYEKPGAVRATADQLDAVLRRSGV